MLAYYSFNFVFGKVFRMTSSPATEDFDGELSRTGRGFHSRTRMMLSYPPQSNVAPKDRESEYLADLKIKFILVRRDT